MRRHKLAVAIHVAACSVSIAAGAQPAFVDRPISAEALDANALIAIDLDDDGDTDVLSASRDNDTIIWYENDGLTGPNFSLRTIATGVTATSVFAADFDGDGDPDVVTASSGESAMTWYENDGMTNPTFDLRTIATDFGAVSVFAADLDGDGDTDILSASRADNTIAWYENDGLSGPAFARQTIATNAAEATSVFAADVDSDGDIDVLSASSADNKIAWYESDGDVSPAFVVHTISTTAEGALSVYAADVDSDGDTDVVSASAVDNKIAWYENDGSTNFSVHTIATDATGAVSVFATDVDGDGDIDVLSASSGDNKIAWYENDGTAKFAPRTISTSASGAHKVFASDVDGDGDMDVLSASEGIGSISWYENQSRRRFSPFISARSIATNALGVRGIFAADIDNDGDKDVLFASSVENKIAWYENDGAPSPQYTLHTISTSANDAKSVFASDVDGDGDTDVLSASSADNKIAWYENTGGANPAFSLRTIATDAGSAASVFAADVDGDGDIDTLSASSADSKIAWYENDGTTNFSIHTITTAAASASSVFASDIDGDGDIDVLSASIADNKIAWYENDGAAPAGFTLRTISTNATLASAVYTADVNGDGDMDVLSASSGDNKIAWYENSGEASPAFTLRTIATNALGISSFSAADIDGDGDIDVLSESSIDQKIAWYANDGASVPGFTLRSISISAETANAVFAADIDGDGDIDVLSASEADNSIAWYPNDTVHRSAGFDAGRSIATDAEGAESVFAADLNRDGHVDVLTASRLDNTIAWYENGGANTVGFAMRTISTSASGARSVYAGDLDGDGDIDVLSASKFDNKIAWYENDGSASPAFVLHTIATNAANAISVFGADMDGDHDLDVLSASRDDNKIAWYENDGALVPGFTLRTVSTGAAVALSVYAADMDGDGDSDILSASSGDDKIAWYENDGAPSPVFSQRTIATNADGAASVFAADMDGDGDTDVLAASINDNLVAWYENDGAGSPGFTLRTISTDAESPFSVFASDMDADGDADVLSVSRLDDKVVWYENDGAESPSFRLRTIATNADNAITAVAADLDNDGDADVLSASFLDDRIAWYRNCGGQFLLRGEGNAGQSVIEGQSITLLTLDYLHNGRIGDSEARLDSAALRFTDGAGNPLNSAQANGLIEELQVYLDDGDMSFDPGLDTLVGMRDALSLTPVALSHGVQAMPMDLNGGVVVSAASHARLFVAARLALDAGSQDQNQFEIVLQQTSLPRSQSSDLASGSVLSPECALSASSGILTIAPLADRILADGFESSQPKTL